MNTRQFYIDGKWTDPAEDHPFPVINPATEEVCATISLGTPADVDRAVTAAARAFDDWGWSPVAERLDLLRKLSAIYRRRSREIAEAMSLEMGAPMTLAIEEQAASGQGHIDAFITALENYSFEAPFSANEPQEYLLREPIGVCGLITPWNWPMNQVTLKVVPALAAGCTAILKPSEIAPLSSLLFAECVDEAGFPPGVFNLVNGDGPTVGAAMSAHPDIQMMSFTGSTRAGIAVTKAAADTVKRVTLELGGKSPNIILADCDLDAAVERGVLTCFGNTGQSCDAPTRMLVERPVYERAVSRAAEVAAACRVGPPAEEGGHIGPLVSHTQFGKVQRLIQAGIDEGARLIAGGPGRPEGFNKGYYVRPTVFADVTPEMTIFREEIFGPVLSMTPVADEAEAIALANDTPYGLAAYLQTGNSDRARRIARRLRAGMVHINDEMQPFGSPFGGYKQSGNGREGGVHGLEDFLEIKAVSGWPG